MTFQVTVNPSGSQFSCDEGETILAAALRAGVGLPYGCKNGACGSCKGKISSGSVTHGNHQQRALSDAEETEGMSLFCCARPDSDVIIEARVIASSGDYPLKKMPSRVAKLEKLSDDVMLIALQLPANERLQYRAGQYIEFCCAMANAAATAWQTRHIWMSKSPCMCVICPADYLLIRYLAP